MKENEKNKVRKYIRGLLENINVFHGSDRKFDEFDIDKIGSGDGKSLGGWGIYFSDSKEVSSRYSLEKGFLKSFELKEGDYFDLDEGLEEGFSYHIIEQLKEKVNEEEIESFQTDYIDYIQYGDITNHQFYDWLSYVLDSEKAASLFLESMGYLGNKFRDKWDSDAMNYVIFNAATIV